ncbi:MAG: gliding motility-associated C-terminal domain-containing protein [Vicingaceae bacterium]|nr:gliding motility-associated C-terminal domain-containing protein [Vicingaceae bacterium]
MKKIVHIIISMLSITTIYSQTNLVPNPSFEEHTGCIFLDTDCNNWMSFKGSPDYFHYCRLNSYNYSTGFQIPRTGEAYAGFIGYDKNILNGREFFGVALTSPLVIGKKYYVSFYVSSGYAVSSINIAHNNIGAMFTTYSYYDPFMVLPHPNFAHIKETKIISDTINWIEISSSFVADSAYTFIIIGNFFNNSLTDTLNFPSSVGNSRSYYYVDDVCVSTDSCLCDTCIVLPLSIPNVFTPNHDGLNDFFKINGLQKGDKVSVFNRWGQLVFKTEDINKFWDGTTLKGSPCPDGVYFYIIEQKKTAKTKTGTVHLLK